jgi:GntR family transcriptional regulator
VRALRYREIADDLRRRVEAGEFERNGLLPSEAELAEAHGASRVTIRRALAELRDVGLVDSRQGFGWYVPADPLVQSLGQLRTIEAELAAAGIRSERRILDFAFVPAPAAVRSVLGSDRVLEVRRVNLGDGSPFARVTVWCPETLARHLSLRDVERASFYELIKVPLGSASQTIAAATATDVDASLLGLPPLAPVLLCRRTTFSEAGDAVLHSEHVFPGHRTEFAVTLPRADRSIAPTGVRLVDVESGRRQKRDP